VKRSFIVAWSLLGFDEFRKGGNRMLYVVWFLVMAVETTISGGDISTFDVSTETAVIALESRLPSDTFGAYVTFGRQ